MKQLIDDRLGQAASAWTDRVRRRPVAIVVATLLVTLVAGVHAALNLGVNMDHVKLIAEDLPFRQNYKRFAERFPILDDAMLVVVDGDTPELARQTAQDLAARMQARPDLFKDVFVPGTGTFFERNGLLFLSVDDLEHLADELAGVQPVLAELSRDLSIVNLSHLLQRGLEEAQSDPNSSVDWAPVLERVGEGTRATAQENPSPLSWESLILGGAGLEPVRRWVIVSEPVLEFGSILPAARPIAQVREEAAALPAVQSGAVRVRLTGNPALNHEELFELFWDIAGAGVFCFLLVTVVLIRALRSWRLTVAALATLLAGLVWTASFAALAVGHVNIVSICFAVLFIGLGIDFGIHLGMHYAEMIRRGDSHEQALHEASGNTGGSLVLCTVTTAIGFYVFVPTDYLGVAELGLIAGTGMIISLFQMLTLFPALISSWLKLRGPEEVRNELHFRRAWWTPFEHRPWVVCGVTLALCAGSLLLLPRLRFDANVIALRDPDTESVQAFNDLLDDAATSPWRMDVAAANPAAARRLSEQFERLAEVERTVTLSDFVPADQDEKLVILEDAALMMDFPPGRETSPASVEAQVEALEELVAFLDDGVRQQAGSELGRSMADLRDALQDFLARVATSEDPAAEFAQLQSILLGSVMGQIDRLQTSLGAEGVGREDLPEDLVERMSAPDGTTRIQVYPKERLDDGVRIARFVDAVRELWPDATGMAVSVFEFGRATVRSLQQALISAVVAIALLLWLLWRRVSEVVITLAPLAAALLITAGVMALIDMPFNFVNVIVLPLLLGIGVDSGIHLVHRSHYALEDARGLLGTTTARAVFYSAVTTIASFGTLSFSSHRGMSSLGSLLVIGLVLTVGANLVLLPALLALRARRRRG